MARRDWVALTLAGGLVFALNLIIIALLSVALLSDRQLTDGTSQVLVAAFGAISGILGSFIGYRAALTRHRRDDDDDTPELDSR